MKIYKESLVQMDLDGLWVLKVYMGGRGLENGATNGATNGAGIDPYWRLVEILFLIT